MGSAALQKVIALEEKEPIYTPILRELPPEKSQITHLFDRGDWRNPAQEVEPGIPASMGSIPDDQPVNSLSFARWLVSDENQLTARVFVNRLWEQIFGYGIIESRSEEQTSELKSLMSMS